MGIYNVEATLDEALESILAQTYTDWQMIMCDDASQDNTYKIAQKYAEKYPEKFILLKNSENMGLNKTLNNCLEYAQGEYIARMDGDDISLPERFEKEIKFLEENPHISIVSTDMFFFDETGIWGRTHKLESPTPASFLRKPPFCHAPCMVRKEAYDAVEGYSVSKKLLRVEDFHLWVKMYEKGYKGINICEPLYMMRDDRNAQNRRKLKYRFNAAYVKGYAVKHLNLPVYNYIFCIVPILKGLLPSGIYKFFHRKTNK